MPMDKVHAEHEQIREIGAEPSAGLGMDKGALGLVTFGFRVLVLFKAGSDEQAGNALDQLGIGNEILGHHAFGVALGNVDQGGVVMHEILDAQLIDVQSPGTKWRGASMWVPKWLGKVVIKLAKGQVSVISVHCLISTVGSPGHASPPGTRGAEYGVPDGLNGRAKETGAFGVPPKFDLNTESTVLLPTITDMW